MSREQAAIELELDVRAFEQGFVAGANPLRARRGTTLTNRHSHWMEGFGAGRDAAVTAARAYRTKLLACSPSAAPGDGAREAGR